MKILVDTPTKLVIRICDIEYSKPGKIINLASLIALTIIFFYLFSIAQGHILAALLITLCVGSPIFLINCLWLGRQNKFFTFDKRLEKLVIEQQSCFVFRVTCALGLFLIIFFILSYSNKIRYTNISDVVSIFVNTLTLGFLASILLYWFSAIFLSELITKLIKRQYIFASKVKVSEYWLRHIKDVKAQCSRTVGMYGIVSEHCQIILTGVLHVEMEDDYDEQCSEQSAQHLVDRIKVFLAN
ncbi:hypothetical protein ACKFKF_25320 [Phormidesmis sp. 146-12]